MNHNFSQFLGMALRALVFSAISFFAGHSLARAQGLATVFPMSKAVSSTANGIGFVLQSQTERELTVRYAWECDIDGKEFKGEGCLEYFDVVSNTELKGGKFSLPSLSKYEARIQYKKGATNFALFKPIFEPAVLADSNNKPGVSFEFGYQPGYLFLLKSPKERVAKVNFSIVTILGTKRLKWALSKEGITIPQLLNVSAKIYEKESKKTVRFLPLAKEKIFDPRRGDLLLEGELVNPKASSAELKGGKTPSPKTEDTLVKNKDSKNKEDKNNSKDKAAAEKVALEAPKILCFELFFNNQFAPDSYKIEGCETTQ